MFLEYNPTLQLQSYSRLECPCSSQESWINLKQASSTGGVHANCGTGSPSKCKMASFEKEINISLPLMNVCQDD